MKYGYVMLTDGNCGDWGQCLLIDESLGQVIVGKKHVKDLPADLLFFLVEGSSSNEKIELLEELLFDSNTYNSSSYNTLTNILYNKKSPYMNLFDNIAQMANYIREHNIILLDNLFY